MSINCDLISENICLFGLNAIPLIVDPLNPLHKPLKLHSIHKQVDVLPPKNQALCKLNYC